MRPQDEQASSCYQDGKQFTLWISFSHSLSKRSGTLTFNSLLSILYFSNDPSITDSTICLSSSCFSIKASNFFQKSRTWNTERENVTEKFCKFNSPVHFVRTVQWIHQSSNLQFFLLNEEKGAKLMNALPFGLFVFFLCSLFRNCNSATVTPHLAWRWKENVWTCFVIESKRNKKLPRRTKLRKRKMNEYKPFPCRIFLHQNAGFHLHFFV